MPAARYLDGTAMSAFRFGLGLAAAASITAVAAIAPSRAQEAPKSLSKSYSCNAPDELVRLDHPLKRVGVRLSAGLPIKIVAIGSSSTAGAGASAPAMSYPSRLEAELKSLWPHAPLKVVNRGVGGETSRDMLARFDTGVFPEKADLVIWQVGSNSLLRGQPVAPAVNLLRDGLDRLTRAGIDAILMNPQYAPKVIAKPEANRMVDLIDATARQSRADLFQRFAVMRYWRLTEDMPFGAFLSPDELHMNDWSYGCIAKLLAGAIADAAMRTTMTATARAPR
jgi:lysophospholipase L1-like esterase